MAKRTSKNFRIKVDEPSVRPVTIDAGRPARDAFCGVNFRYFQQQHECLSDWQRGEVKHLATWISKQAKRTVSQIQSNTDTCHAHRGPQAALPDEISEDVRLYGLDVTSAARVHGFFNQNTFFLVWLDRTHSFHQ